jgi:DNA-binding GntR family transcriptional regulator
MDLALQLPLKGETLSERVYAVLKDAIFTGKIKPGDTIREMHAARLMKVSQATVREALAQLERVGLVVRHTNRRTCVTSFSREEVKERLELRLLLEKQAIAHACEQMTDDDLRHMHGLSDELLVTIEAQDYFENVLADMRFHRFIWQRCGNRTLAATLDQLTTPLFAFLSIMHKLGMVDLRTTKPHTEIVAALESRVPERAEAAISRHIQGAYGRFLDTGADSLNALMKEHEREREILLPQ